MTTYGCDHPGCFATARFVAMDNVPAHAHLCTWCLETRSEEERAHYVPVTVEVIRPAVHAVDVVSAYPTAMAKFGPKEVPLSGSLGVTRPEDVPVPPRLFFSRSFRGEPEPDHVVVMRADGRIEDPSIHLGPEDRFHFTEGTVVRHGFGDTEIRVRAQTHEAPLHVPAHATRELVHRCDEAFKVTNVELRGARDPEALDIEVVYVSTTILTAYTKRTPWAQPGGVVRVHVKNWGDQDLRTNVFIEGHVMERHVP